MRKRKIHEPLSFPTSTLPTPFAFNFPLPVPLRHLPPPHPGQSSLISIQSHSSSPSLANYQRLHHSYSNSPISPSFSLSLTSSRRKRPATQPPLHHFRLKKVKLAHPFFRSPRLFYPLNYSRCLLVHPPTSSCLSQSSPPTYRVMECPRWLHTSAAVEGQSSRLCPKEARFTGSAQSWSTSPSPKSSTAKLSSPPQSASSGSLPRASRNLPSASSHAAPLKAQLLAVLRMRSSLQPGEAALRLKKWVIWNSWVRGHAQRRLYPITKSTCGSVPATSNIRASIPTNSPGDEWTGDEMFDENGDLVCEDDDLDSSDDIENKSYPAPMATVKTNIVNAQINETIGTQRMSRSKVPPRIDTSKYPSNLTPPSSPESQSNHDDENKLENESCKSTVVVTNLLGQIQVSKVDSKPLTPPPSPPNQTCK